MTHFGLAVKSNDLTSPSAPNVQHLNCPKKCCTLGTLLHIGDIAQENEIFLKNILVLIFLIFGLPFSLRKNYKTKNAREKSQFDGQKRRFIVARDTLCQKNNPYIKYKVYNES